MATLPHPDAPEQPAAGQTSLADLLATTQAWGDALLRQLDGPSRLQVFRVSRALQLWVLQSAPQATVTLLAYSGLSEDTWQRRLALAEQALATRGPGQRQNTKVVLRIPTPHPTALQSTLSMAEAARQCYAALEVQQYDYPTTAGPDAAPNPLQPWPAAVPLPIHTLILKHMCGPLPSPALLPQLRELRVQFSLSSRGALRQRCASIAPFLPQLSSLSLERYFDRDWSVLFGSRVSTSLKHFATDAILTDTLLQLLLKYAPQLEQLSCARVMLTPNGAFRDQTWVVRELACEEWCLNYAGRAGVADLPKSPQGLTLMQGPGRLSYITVFDMDFHIVGRQGLDAALAQRLAHTWRFAAPIIAHLRLPTDLAQEDIQTATEAALMQLSVLPAGSKVQLICRERETWEHAFAPAVAAMAATAHDLSHLTVVTPPPEYSSEHMVTLCEHEPPLTHVALHEVDEYSEATELPWPWQCLHITGHVGMGLSFSDILNLPDPTAGQYEIESQHFDLHDMEEWDTDTITELHNRLQHITFNIRDRLEININRHEGITTRKQPTALRGILQALAACRWRRVSDRARINVTLDGWDITKSVIPKLSGLPVFDVPCKLTFARCTGPRKSSFTGIPSVVPACYSTWEVWAFSQRWGVAHIKQVCMGVAARAGAGQKLSLVVQFAEGQYTVEDRTEVEACVDGQGVSGCVEVQWDLSQH